MSKNKTVERYAGYFTIGFIAGGLIAMFATRFINNCNCTFINENAHNFNCTINKDPNVNTGKCFSDCFRNQTNYDNLMHAYNKDCINHWRNNNYIIITVVAIISGCIAMCTGKPIAQFTAEVTDKLTDSAASLLGKCCGLFSRSHATRPRVTEIELVERPSVRDESYMLLR